jgi:hypothetical protein
MVRQIQFTPEQASELSRRAKAKRMSIAAYVRGAVDATLAKDERPPTREELWQRSLAAVGKYRDPSGENVAEDHDRYLDEAYGDWQEKPR